ncbi:MAG: fibronectin type III domain-containing protein, partial [Anaerolineae bacterium]|nr:fibronectin type III domain-containing protein [Anaerolineae bacterium]
MLVYGPDATPLELGRHYAFRILARSITGVDQLDLFKNNGYSEVYSFIYGDACTPPTNIQATPEGSSRINVSWTENPNHTNYTLRYQLADKNTDWYLSNSLISNIQIDEVAPNTRYQFQVKAFCGNYESDFSPVTYITSNPVAVAAYSCGLPIKIDPPDPTHLIESLKPGDIVMAGDFPVKLTKVWGSNGIFSGEGVVEIPFFNKAKAKVEFTNITVNQELRLVAGEMNVVGAPVEVVPSGVMDFMDDLTEVLDFADSLLDVVEKNLPGYFDESSFVAEKEVRIEGAIKQIYKAADGTVVVVDDKGKETTIPAGTTAAVIDSNGNAYLVDAKGKAHAVSVAVAEKAARREYNLSATFANTRDSKFGFDAKRYDPLTPHYEKISKEQYVSWKSVETGKTDAVAVQLNGDNDPSEVHFEQGGIGIGHQALGVQSASSQGLMPNAQGLTIRGSSDGVEEGLLALYTPADSSKKEQVVGKLNVVTYNAIHERVIIVGVNGNKFEEFGTPEQLRDSLNAIYGQAVVHWNVEIPGGIQVPNISPFDNGTSGLLSNYTGHMKSVINAYKDYIQGNTYYLFLVSNAQDATRLGYMPRSKKFGFIFADKHSDLSSISRSIAHELAHGAYNLHHTFMEPNFTITKGTTDNLLDYPAGDKLYKFQWDKIRYPDIVMGMFEEDEEARLLLI